MTYQKFKQTEIGKIPEDWEKIRLGDYLKLNYGKSLSENNRKFGKISVFGSNGVTGFHNESLVKGPGIIIGRKGSVGEIKLSKSDFWPIDTTYYLTKEDTELNLIFLYYKLLTLGINKMNSHAAVPGLNREDVYIITTGIPPLPEQLSIAKILSSLDAKIELNNKMNKTLEAIGQALFKKWFIDNPEKENWKEGKLGDLIEIKNGFAFKGKDFLVEGVPVVKIKNVKARKILLDNLSFVSQEIFNLSKNYKINFGDIIITMSGNRFDGSRDTWVGKVAMFNKKGNYLLNQRLSIINVEEKFSCLKHYLYMFLSSEELQDYFINASTSSGGQANISPDLIRNIKIIIPDEKTLQDFNKIIQPIFKQISINCFQSQTLSSLRDTLLPKLMSGEVRVK